MTNYKKILLAGAGLIMFAIGTIGVLLPVMPTVPFYLVAAVCFAKSSDKLDRWFKGTQLYKQYIDRFFVDKSMYLGIKILLTILGTAAAVGAFIFCYARHWTAPCIVTCILWVEMIIYLFFMIKNKKNTSS